MGTSGDGDREPWHELIDGKESEALREARHYEIMFRLAFLKATDLVTRAMYQNKWKGWGQ